MIFGKILIIVPNRKFDKVLPWLIKSEISIFV